MANSSHGDITPSHVKKVAKMARLSMGDDLHVEKMVIELNAILHWVDQLIEVETEGVAPLMNPAQLFMACTPQRQDVVTDGDIVAAILSNAPQQAFSMFAVPKVVG